MSATILLARHATHAEVGMVLSGRSAIALNEAGRVEAERLAVRLDEADIAAIHSSPRRRAIETAAAVAARKGLKVKTVAALDEIDFGAWSGRRFTALDEDAGWQQWNAARATATTPGGETMAAVAARARAHIEAAAIAGRTLLCVSHADVIRGLVADWMGMGAARMLDFDIDPASLTTMTIDRGHVRLVALNERVH